MLQYSTAIVRLNKDGSIDKSFGKSGLFRKRISEDVSCNYLFDLVIAPNGNIYAATSNYTYIDAESKTVRDLGVMSITKDGTLNTSFGTNGFASSDVDGGNDDAVSLAFTPNRKIVLGATSYTASGCKFVVLRYNTDVETGYEQPFTDADNNGKSFEVYPNPTKDILNINAKGIGSSYKIQMYFADVIAKQQNFTGVHAIQLMRDQPFYSDTNVVFPDSLGPHTPINSPSSKERLIPFKAIDSSALLYCHFKSRISTTFPRRVPWRRQAVLPEARPTVPRQQNGNICQRQFGELLHGQK